MTGLAVLAILESAILESLPAFCLSCKIQHKKATVTALAVLAVLVVYDGFSRDGYPP